MRYSIKSKNASVAPNNKIYRCRVKDIKFIKIKFVPPKEKNMKEANV